MCGLIGVMAAGESVNQWLMKSEKAKQYLSAMKGIINRKRSQWPMTSKWHHVVMAMCMKT